MTGRNFNIEFVAVAVAAICVAMPGHALATEDEPGAWLAFSLSGPFSQDGEESRWHYWVDSQARFFDPGSGANQLLIRPAIGYRVSDNVKAWVGYARFRSRSAADAVSHENRYWQQVDWPAGRLLGGNVSMRARLEQRSVSVGEDVGLVLRFLTKYVRPIGADGTRSLVIGIEPFVDLKKTDWAGDSGFGQNRAFVGLGWRVNDSLSVEAGYMNQFIQLDNREDRSFHHGVLNFNVRL